MLSDKFSGIDEAIFALGCKVAYGTYNKDRLAIITNQEFDYPLGLPGEFVLIQSIHESDRTCTTAKPISRTRIKSGEYGLLTDIVSCSRTPLTHVDFLTIQDVVKELCKT